MNLDEAYRRCEEITTTEARNFSYGIKLLPRPSARPCPPSTPWPGGSTTSATATSPVPDKLAALAEARKDVAAVAGDDPYRRATTRCWSPWPTCTGASRSRSPPSTS